MLTKNKISIIGTGNLGSSIANGLLKENFPPSNLSLTDMRVESLKPFAEKGVTVGTNNIDSIKNADIIIVAVKPHNVELLFHEIATHLQSNQLLISVVSGTSIEKIKTWLKDCKTTICRVMPNTAIAINQSMTCISAPQTNEEQKRLITELFSGLGESVFINEELMDSATVLGACGIAFAMRFIRAMVQGGIEIGFDSKTASLIANQTVKGAAELLIQNKLHPEEEIDKVTTPKGFTITGLNEMEHNGFSSSLIKGILTSYRKIEKANL